MADAPFRLASLATYLHSGGGQVSIVAGFHFLKILPLPACQGEGDHDSGGRGPLKNGKW